MDPHRPKSFQPSSSLIGEWQTTPSCPVTGPTPGGQFYQWKDLTPFGIETPADFLLPAPPAITSNKYAKDFLEVRTVGASQQRRASGGSGLKWRGSTRRRRRVSC